MKKILVFLFVIVLPVSAGNGSTPATEENAIEDIEIEVEVTIKDLWEAKRTGVNTAVLGTSLTVLGGTVFSKGGPEIAGLGFGFSVAGVTLSALGCYINFANKRRLKRFLEERNITLEIE